MPASVIHRRGSGLWLVLPIVGLALVAVLGAVIWASPSRSPAQQTPTPAVGNGAVQDQVRTSTAKGSSAGYDAIVQSARTDVGSETLTRFDVFLSTEGEPASAPTAGVVLTGADRKTHTVSLTIIGSGHWASGQFKIAPGRYRLAARFDRQGKQVLIPMTISLK